MFNTAVPLGMLFADMYKQFSSAEPNQSPSPPARNEASVPNVSPEKQLLDSVFQAPWNFSTPGYQQPAEGNTGGGFFAPEQELFDAIFKAPWTAFTDVYNAGQGGGASATPPIPTPGQRPRTEEQATPPAGEEEAAPEKSASGVGDRFGNSIAPPQFAGPQTVPGMMLKPADAFRTAMLQTGLNLMVPQWGGPIAQIGQALGQGAEAVQRREAGLQAQQNKGLDTQLKQSQIAATNALTSARKESAETSRAKRVKGGSTGTSQYERLAAQLGLGPEGSAYFKERLKDIEEVDPLDAQLGAPVISPMEQFAQALEEARQLDQKSAGKNGETVPATASPEISPKYKKGDIVEGRNGVKWRFNGGDESNKDNWEEVK